MSRVRCVAALFLGAGLSLHAAAATAAPQRAARPITDAEAQAFAERVVMAGTQNVVRVTDVLDVDEMAALIAEKMTVDLPGAIEGAKQSIEQDPLFSQVRPAVAGGGSYTLLRVHEVDGQPRALVRLLLPDGGGVNYHDFRMIRSADGRVRADDLLIYMTGEFFSDTVAQLMNTMAARRPGAIGRALGQKDKSLEEMQELQKMQAATRAEDYAKALSIYDSLPQSLKEQKAVILLRIRAAMNTDDKAYEAAMADHLRLFPDDPAADFIGIDYHLLGGRIDECLDSVRSLNKKVQDPYLNNMMAGVMLEAGRAADAEKEAEKAIAAEPDMMDAHWMTMTASMQQKDFDAVLRDLKRMDKQFEMEWADLTTVPEFAPFVASPQHEMWLKYLEAK